MNNVKKNYDELRNSFDSLTCNNKRFSEDGVKKSATESRKDLMKIINTAKEMRKNISTAKESMGKKSSKKPVKKQ